jgi:hypothetical protein
MEPPFRLPRPRAKPTPKTQVKKPQNSAFNAPWLDRHRVREIIEAIRSPLPIHRLLFVDAHVG